MSIHVSYRSTPPKGDDTLWCGPGWYAGGHGPFATKQAAYQARAEMEAVDDERRMESYRAAMRTGNIPQ